MTDAGPHWTVLGIAQDGGVPHAGCRRDCCAATWLDPRLARHVACGAIVDGATGRCVLIDATPDIGRQLHMLDRTLPIATSGNHRAGDTTERINADAPLLEGIYLTHEHYGHIAGLLQLGREVMDVRGVPVWCRPEVARFLAGDRPWSLLVARGHIVVHEIDLERPVEVNDSVRVTAFSVPHRGAIGDTVGYRIEGPTRSLLWLPDIDAWDGWDTGLEPALRSVDVAYLDGTFFDSDELRGRDPTRVPHPPIVDTLDRLAGLPGGERAKVRFIHLNHTNPALDPTSPEARAIAEAGSAVAKEGERVAL